MRLNGGSRLPPAEQPGHVDLRFSDDTGQHARVDLAEFRLWPEAGSAFQLKVLFAETYRRRLLDDRATASPSFTEEGYSLDHTFRTVIASLGPQGQGRFATAAHDFQHPVGSPVPTAQIHLLEEVGENVETVVHYYAPGLDCRDIATVEFRCPLLGVACLLPA